MLPRILALALPLAMLVASPAMGQTQLLKDFARQHLHLWASPFEHPQRALKIGAPLALATGLLLRADQPVIYRYLAMPAPWAVHTSHAGDIASLAGGALALYGAGRLLHHEAAAQMGSDSLLALAHSSLMVQALKVAIHRQRPDGSNHGSMPSGHAMTAFALAGAISAHPQAPRWVKVVAPAAAGVIAFARVGARRHYPSDVALGSTLGWLIGRAAGHR